jgi:GNAT superfamily N-acetyltransferase
MILVTTARHSKNPRCCAPFLVLSHFYIEQSLSVIQILSSKASESPNVTLPGPSLFGNFYIALSPAFLTSCQNPRQTSPTKSQTALFIPTTNTNQLEYRLRTCGELSSGLFSSAYPTTSGPLGDMVKTRKFPSIDSSDADRKRVLLGHIIATKTTTRLVTDDAMAYPKDWQTKYQLSPSTGHNEDGETVCIHSLCVHPDFEGQGFGKILLKSYVQRIKDAGVAKRVALICRDRYVGFYEKAGFAKVGPSACQYGGGNWVDMVMEFEGGDDDYPEY